MTCLGVIGCRQIMIIAEFLTSVIWDVKREKILENNQLFFPVIKKPLTYFSLRNSGYKQKKNTHTRLVVTQSKIIDIRNWTYNTGGS